MARPSSANRLDRIVTRAKRPLSLPPCPREVRGKSDADRPESIGHVEPASRLERRSYENAQPADQCEYRGKRIEPHAKWPRRLRMELAVYQQADNLGDEHG